MFCNVSRESYWILLFVWPGSFSNDGASGQAPGIGLSRGQTIHLPGGGWGKNLDKQTHKKPRESKPVFSPSLNTISASW